MKIPQNKFKILVCIKTEFADIIRQIVAKSDTIHIQYTSSPRFLMSRAIFTAPHLVLIDASFEKYLLQDMLATFRLQFNDVSVFMVASSVSHRDAVDAMSCGASEYYALPGDARQLSEQVNTMEDHWQTMQAQQRFIDLQHKAYDFNQIIGESESLRGVLDRAKKVIDNPLMTVLITGETGTGKELLARAIHYNSKNGNSPFVDIACSALPETLLESELFGFEKGAFTDAREKKLGLFELAGDGTIFLDEIGDISLAMQSKLLKVIESRTMRRLGGLKDIPVKGRIVAATSVDLTAKMKSGQFRKDLYHRLKIIPLEIPPLRERRGDILSLVDSFVRLFNGIYGKSICGTTPEALDLLTDHEWEGNVRELKHTIERAVLLEEQEWLTEKDFDFLNTRGMLNGVEYENRSNGNVLHPIHKDSTLTFTISLAEAALEDVQLRLALNVLNHVGGNKSKAAAIMRISRPRLDRILATANN